MNGFPLDVGADEPRGGSITIEPFDDECAVTVAFTPTLKDELTAEARAVVEGLEDGLIVFAYVIKRFDIEKLMEDIRVAINHLNQFEDYAFSEQRSRIQ